MLITIKAPASFDETIDVNGRLLTLQAGDTSMDFVLTLNSKGKYTHLTHYASGRICVHGVKTVKSAQAALDSLLTRINGGVEHFLERIEGAPILNTSHTEYRKPARKPAPPVDMHRKVKLMVLLAEQNIELSELELEALDKCFGKRGDYAGYLTKSAPNSFKFPLANAIYNAITPNVFKMQVGNLMMMSKDVRPTYDKLSGFKYPVWLDKDREQLTKMGAW